MKALILNSGFGSRMGKETKSKPKCMVELLDGETILKRQLRLLHSVGIREVVITTGAFCDVLMDYVRVIQDSLEVTFVNNPRYSVTNYIYSIYLAKQYLMNDDIVLMHGDLVFEKSVLMDIIEREESCMVVDRMAPLSEKDFKARVESGWIKEIGINVFENAVAAQPLYFIKQDGFRKWLAVIEDFCNKGETAVYAENALNTLLESEDLLRTLDVSGRICNEVDTPEDLIAVGEMIYGKG